MEALIKALRHEDVAVRMMAVHTLGLIDEPAKDAVSALIGALVDKHREVRVRAVEVLERIGTPEALKAVEEFERQNNLEWNKLNSSL